MINITRIDDDTLSSTDTILHIENDNLINQNQYFKEIIKKKIKILIILGIIFYYIYYINEILRLLL
jgi:hypothetical protein